MNRGIGSWALLFGAGWLVASCGGPAADEGGGEPSAGAESPLEASSATFNDFRGTWHGVAQMGAAENDIRAVFLVIGQESVLCQRPGVGCVPAEVRVERGTLVVKASVPGGETVEALEGRFAREGESVLKGPLRSSACNCSGDARLDLSMDDASFEGQWEATISFDPVRIEETRALPVEFRSPEPFVLRVREHGAEACSEAEGGCVQVEWIPQGPQAAFHFEREHDGVRVRTNGYIGRMSNGQIEGEILREGGEHRRHGRMYLRQARSGGAGASRGAGTPGGGGTL